MAASGAQAKEAIDAIVALAENGFGDKTAVATTTVATPSGPLPASPGIGIGPKWSIGTGDIAVPATTAATPDQEWRSLQAAITTVTEDITMTRDRMRRRGDDQNAAIFDAHLLLLTDTEILADVRDRIGHGAGGGAAWDAVLRHVEEEWAESDNTYLNARATDVRSVRNQVLQRLLGVEHQIISQPGILVASDLTPNEIALLDTDVVDGIVTAAGSPTSHTAILARALAVPAVVGAGQDVLDLPDGTNLIIDGSDGTLLVEPSAGTVRTYQARADEMADAETAALRRAQQPAVTRDGRVVEVAANIGAIGDAPLAVAAGADSVGVLRTEFLFLDRSKPPTIAEQEDDYRAIAVGLEGRQLTIRTLDVGGDKSIEYLALPHEANPFLGLRGIRVGLGYPELLRDQLTAAIRVAKDHPVSVLFPMVTAVAELDQALEMLDQVCDEQGGRPPDLEVGMMVEVPAVATNAAAFASRVDLLSIGTNDLTQYALAAERGNQTVAHLADTLDPGVLRLIQSVVVGSGGCRVAVCGEIAADLTAVPILIGLGVGELSVAPYAVPRVKDEIRRWSYSESAALARDAVALESGPAVRALVEQRR